jgi:hypothetical protein
MLRAILIRVGIGVLAIVILMLSVVKTGWELMAEEGVLDQMKTGEMAYTIRFSDGETMPTTYKLPDAGMLPNQMFYGAKTIRDFLWLYLSHGIDKIELSILLADKKAKEFDALVKIDKPELALESGNQAIDKLQYADKLITEDNSKNPEVKLLRTQVLRAGYAYKEIFQNRKDNFPFNSEEYNKLLSRVDEWNKQEEETRFNWNY